MRLLGASPAGCAASGASAAHDAAVRSARRSLSGVGSGTASASASPSNSPPRPARTTPETLPKQRGLSRCMQQPHMQQPHSPARAGAQSQVKGAARALQEQPHVIAPRPPAFPRRTRRARPRRPACLGWRPAGLQRCCASSALLCLGRPQQPRLCPRAAGWSPARLQGCRAVSARPSLGQPRGPCFSLEAGCSGRGARRCGTAARGAVR